MENPQTIAVLGLGYVGCVSAACLAELGHRVTGVDPDVNKVRSVLDGRAPFYEPGLEDLVRRNAAAGRLSASTGLAGAVQDASIALICVGTPSDRNGNLSLDQLRRASQEIASLLPRRSSPLIVAIRSTAWPGTAESIYSEVFANSPLVSMVSNPEFLREGCAVRDFLEPSLLVVGGSDAAAANVVARLYAPLPVTPCLVSLRTAEMIKYACNAFHAVKVSFANEIGALCDRLSIPAREVMDTLCRDEKLNVSRAYLKPGFAFGGSCLPKDLRALTYRASRLDVDLPLLTSALPSNERHLRRAIDAVMDLPASRIGVAGLAFKEDTDDLRESPVVGLLEYLLGKGRAVRVYDRHIRLDVIYGSNRHFLLNAIPHIGRLLENSVDDLLAWAEQVVVTQPLDAGTAGRIAASGLPVLDLARTGMFPGSAADR